MPAASVRVLFYNNKNSEWVKEEENILFYYIISPDVVKYQDWLIQRLNAI